METRTPLRRRSVRKPKGQKEYDKIGEGHTSNSELDTSSGTTRRRSCLYSAGAIKAQTGTKNDRREMNQRLYMKVVW